jgi:hypothetical protein
VGCFQEVSNASGKLVGESEPVKKMELVKVSGYRVASD